MQMRPAGSAVTVVIDVVWAVQGGRRGAYLLPNQRRAPPAWHSPPPPHGPTPTPPTTPPHSPPPGPRGSSRAPAVFILFISAWIARRAVNAAAWRTIPALLYGYGSFLFCLPRTPSSVRLIRRAAHLDLPAPAFLVGLFCHCAFLAFWNALIHHCYHTTPPAGCRAAAVRSFPAPPALSACYHTCCRFMRTSSYLFRILL